MTPRFVIRFRARLTRNRRFVGFEDRWVCGASWKDGWNVQNVRHSAARDRAYAFTMEAARAIATQYAHLSDGVFVEEV